MTSSRFLHLAVVKAIAAFSNDAARDAALGNGKKRLNGKYPGRIRSAFVWEASAANE